MCVQELRVYAFAEMFSRCHVGECFCDVTVLYPMSFTVKCLVIIVPAWILDGSINIQKLFINYSHFHSDNISYFKVGE